MLYPRTEFSWFVLELLGINLSLYLQRKTKILGWILPTTLFFSYAWNMYGFFQGFRLVYLKYILPRIIIFTFQMIIWCSLWANRKKLKTLHAMLRVFGTENYGIERRIFSDVCIALSFSLPTLKAVLTIYFTNGCTDSIKCRYYLKGFSPNDEEGVIVFLLNSHLSDFVQLGFPTLVNLVFCRLSGVCKEVLSHFSERMRRMADPCFFGSRILLLHRYRYAWKTVKLLEGCFSTTVLFLIMTQVLNLFICLSGLMSDTSTSLSPTTKAEHVVKVVFYTLLFVAVVESSVQVSHRFDEILTSLCDLSEEILMNPLMKKHEWLVEPVAALVRKGPVVITAFEVVNMERGLVFSVFGSILTYGLLIIQITV